MRIEVAPLIQFRSAFAGPLGIVDNAGLDLPWDQRPKVTVKATLDTTIRELIADAAEKMALEERPGMEPSPEGVLSNHYLKVAFHGQGVSPSIVPLDAVLKEDGSVDWYFNQHSVTIRQLMIARENHLFHGDPRRMYLILDDAAAGGGGIDYWLEVLQSLPYVEAFLAAHGLTTATTGTVLAFAAVIRRLSNRFELSGSLGKYASLFAVPRSPAQMAAFLQRPDGEVRAICHFLGMELVDGAWRPANKPGDREYRELIRVVDRVSEWEISETVRQKAFAEILSIPVGERLKSTEPVLRRLNYMEAEGLD